MSIDLGRRLISAGVVPPDEVEAALFLSTVRGVPFARVLLDRGAVSERALEEELERVGGLGLRQVVGASDLVARLQQALTASGASLAVARTGAQPQRVFSLCRRELLPSLGDYLGKGGRKVACWHDTLTVVEVAFDDQAAAFENINTCADLQRLATDPVRTP